MYQKNSILISFFSFLSLFIFLSCSAQKKCKNCGIVVFKNMFYEPSLKKYVHDEPYGPDTKVWFKDSIAIVKTMGIHAPTVNGVETKREVVLMFYTFIDLRKMLFYKYATFYDTAKIIQSYNKVQADTVFWNVNWRFYQYHDIPYTEPLENLPDTIIEGKVFQRIRIINKPTIDTTNIRTSIAYFDCERKGTMFQIDKSLSEKKGCPMVKYYILPSIKYAGAIAGEIEFVSDKLTPEELKIFDAWERNVKKYPIKE
jgi:hypothetical protein